MVPGIDWGDLAGNQCVIAFGRPTWDEFRKDQGKYADYSAMTPQDLTKRTVFIPNTNRPFEIRECLIEEITQALGPLNDIYGLGPSIFNDDDAHTWPTRLDYLMLRVLYDPEMKAGIRRREAHGRALKILKRINPDGIGAPRLPPHRQMDFINWRNALHTLFRLTNAGELRSSRVNDLLKAVLTEAERRAPDTAYHCEALSAVAHVEYEREDPDADDLIRDAGLVCERVHGLGDVRLATLRLAAGLHHLGQDSDRLALQNVAGLEKTFLAHGQDALIAMTYAVRWTALANLDRPGVEEARRKTLAWSAYAYGDDNETVRRWRRY